MCALRHILFTFVVSDEAVCCDQPPMTRSVIRNTYPDTRAGLNTEFCQIDLIAYHIGEEAVDIERTRTVVFEQKIAEAYKFLIRLRIDDGNVAQCGISSAAQTERDPAAAAERKRIAR